MSAQLEEERKQYAEQLEIVVASLKDDTGNAELLALKDELDQMVKLIDDSLEELKPVRDASKPAPVKAPSPPPVQEKWSRENHPAFKKAAPPPIEEKEQDIQPTSYNVNDNVMAKWVSGDKGFYTARITAVTGSATARMYTVKFKSYDTVETLRIKDIRPIAQKRKADGTAVVNSPAATTPTPATHTPSAAAPQTTAASSSSGNGVVLSAPATLYPEAQQVKKDGAEKNADDPAKPKAKKIKATKELEAGKSKWQEFNSKSKFAKTHKKDSMFRTPEGIHGRVGFTGSGQAMRKDPTRSRHIYQANDELD